MLGPTVVEKAIMSLYKRSQHLTTYFKLGAFPDALSQWKLGVILSVVVNLTLLVEIRDETPTSTTNTSQTHQHCTKKQQSINFAISTPNSVLATPTSFWVFLSVKDHLISSDDVSNSPSCVDTQSLLSRLLTRIKLSRT